jgi:hypothetical protein
VDQSIQASEEQVPESKMDRLVKMLEEVNTLYSQKYPLDSLGDPEQEVGYDSDGMLWVRYAGDAGASTVETEDVPDATRAARLERLLDEVKGLYSAKFPLDDVDDVGKEVGRDPDGLLWV